MRSLPPRPRLTPAFVTLLLIALAAAPAAAAPAAAASPLRSLQRTLARDLRSAHGRASAIVIDASTGGTVFSAAANTPRLPASAQKLYTTATALLEFGAGARFQTSVLGVGSLGSGGVWHGTLYLRGGGDPTFGGSAFDQAAYGTGATVEKLAASVYAAGIRRIDGQIVGDESRFDSLRGTPATGFAPDLEYEGELSALAFDAGFQSDYETALQPRPALFAANAFVAALRTAHVRVPSGTSIFTGVTPPGAEPVAAVRSPTLATLIELTNSPSDNFFAETLLKDIGARFGGAGTTAAGAAVVRAVIAQRFGLDPAFDDGSGLSRDDRTTAAQLVALLRRMQSNASFLNSLAIAGVRGTMQGEMLGTRAAGNCRGKTGTLSDVANLSGYCTARNGDVLVFAFLMNSLRDPNAGHAIEDRMGIALANYAP